MEQSDIVVKGDHFNAYILRQGGELSNTPGHGSINFFGQECAGRIAEFCPFEVKRVEHGQIVAVGGASFIRKHWRIEKVVVSNPPGVIVDEAIPSFAKTSDGRESCK